MELNFSVTLTEELYRELIEGCRDCACSPKQVAAESLESVLASRRLPRVEAGRCGPRIGGGFERETEPEAYPVHYPERPL
jgi:hypothetical protein